MDMMVLEEEEYGEVKLVKGVITQPRLRLKSSVRNVLQDSKLQAPYRTDELTTKNSLVPEKY